MGNGWIFPFPKIREFSSSAEGKSIFMPPLTGHFGFSPSLVFFLKRHPPIIRRRAKGALLVRTRRQQITRDSNVDAETQSRCPSRETRILNGN